MFGDSMIDFMNDEELKKLSPVAQRYAMRRRRRHQEETSQRYRAVVIVRHGQVRGVALLLCQADGRADLNNVIEALAKQPHDSSLAATLQHQGIVLLDYVVVDDQKNDVAWELDHRRLGAVRPGESGRDSAIYPFSMDGARPEDGPFSVLCCEQCSREYDPVEAEEAMSAYLAAAQACRSMIDIPGRPASFCSPECEITHMRRERL